MFWYSGNRNYCVFLTLLARFYNLAAPASCYSVPYLWTRLQASFLFLQPPLFQTPSAHRRDRISSNELTLSLSRLRMANVSSPLTKHPGGGVPGRPGFTVALHPLAMWPQVGTQLPAQTAPSFLKLYPSNITPEWLWESFPNAQGKIQLMLISLTIRRLGNCILKGVDNNRESFS